MPSDIQNNLSPWEGPGGNLQHTPLLALGFCLFGIVIGFALNLNKAIEIQMHKNPPGWHVSAIPPALSVDRFGQKQDYTGLVDVRDRFLSKLTGQDAPSVNAAISYALETDPGQISKKTYLLGADDKGVVDFVRFSFLIFGYRVEGFLYTYFLILGISSLFYILAFWENLAALFPLAAYFAAHLAFFPTAMVNPELKSVIAMRFFPVISMIACLHIIMIVMQNRKNWSDMVLITLQGGIIIFTIHIRHSAIWQVGAVGLATLLFMVVGTCVEIRKGPIFSNRFVKRISIILGPFVFLLLGLSGLKIHQRFSYAQEYQRGEQILGHVVWHSFFTGLCYHPSLAKELDLKIDDVSVARALGRYLLENHRATEWDEIGGTSPGFRDIRWAPYDLLVREMYFHIWKTHPGKSLAAAIYYRPRALFQIMAWLARLIHDPPYLGLLDKGGQQEFRQMGEGMDKFGLSFKPFNPSSLLILLPFFVFYMTPHKKGMDDTVISFAILFWGALMPTLLIYPIAHTIGEPAIAVTMLLYFLILFISSWTFSMLKVAFRLFTAPKA